MVEVDLYFIITAWFNPGMDHIIRGELEGASCFTVLDGLLK